jgi:hypothetical protein
MSSESSPQTGGQTAPNQPPRNPAERIVVWGLILGLLGVVGVEAMARFSYGNSLRSLEAALARDEQGDTLTVEEVAGHISGFPQRQDDPDKRVLTYTWRGLLKTYGSITMRYSRDSEVVGLETADAPSEQEVVVENDDSGEEEEEASGETEGGGRGGRGGGGFDPMQWDTDGDGKLSREELPERMQENFDEIDTNGDGFADEAEFAARRAAFQRRRGQGGRGGNGGDRPQRPQRPDFGGASEDSDTEAPPPDETDASSDANTEQ